MKVMIRSKKRTSFRIIDDGVLAMRNRMYISNDESLKREILKGAHKTCLTIHPRSTKMYKDLKGHYWWPSMKKR